MFDHVTSDTHFFHANIIRLAQRPFGSVSDMHEALIANWNARVAPGQTVLHLGDFAFNRVKADEIRSVRDRLNGRIILCLGNHDDPEMLLAASVVRPEDIRFWVPSRDRVAMFSHLPLEPYLLFRSRVSVHGHTHGQASDLDPELHRGSISVNCELTGYAPVSRAEIESRIAIRAAEVGSSWADRNLSEDPAPGR